MEGAESLEQLQVRHRRELKDLQGRITNKKKNATKKTRKGVNDECAELELQLRERHAAEMAGQSSAAAANDGKDQHEAEDGPGGERPPQVDEVNGNGEVDEAARQLEQTRLAEAPPASAAPNGANSDAGRKRNRQKERMARREAERVAAAEAAETEAAGMVDHRGLEKEGMERTFAANGLVEKDIQPDGHCLFSAVADQLTQAGIPVRPAGAGDIGDAGQPPYKVVRVAAADYMSSHPDDFAPFLEEPLDAHLARIRDTAEWGGQLELLALANTYGVDIRVVQDGRTGEIRPTTAAGAKATVWLAYYRHGYGLGEHYNSLRKKKA